MSFTPPVLTHGHPCSCACDVWAHGAAVPPTHSTPGADGAAFPPANGCAWGEPRLPRAGTAGSIYVRYVTFTPKAVSVTEGTPKDSAK